jgi:predicted metal-dependent enzyme (double-stranded beta helix superfamily)
VEAQPLIAKVIYKPLGLTLSILGGMLAGAAFEETWKLVAQEEDAPKAADRERTWREVLPAAAVHGAVFGLVTAAADRAGASGFHRATGTWPA